MKLHMKRLLPAVASSVVSSVALLAALGIAPLASGHVQASPNRSQNRPPAPARNAQPNTPQATPQATPSKVQPAARAADGAVVAEAKVLPETIELTGLFEPADVVEVKIDLDKFAEPLKIQQLANHGQQVKQGDVVLAVEPEALQRALAAAESKKAVAEINLSKAKTDASVGNETDALALRAAQRKLAKAEEALSWFESVDGVAFLEGAEMMVQRSEDAVEDQTEELEQLRKMYQSEELTEDTADIVVKRAIRGLDYAKRQLELNKKRAQKMREKDYADQKQDLIDALDATRLANVQLENDQAARKVQRDAALLGAEEAARQAAEEHEKLAADAGKLAFVAPADGWVYYGQLTDGNWAGASADALEVGDEVKPDQVVMTFFQPGAMQVTVDLPEAQRFQVKPDATAKITPSALPTAVVEAKVKQISPLAVQKGPARVFEVTLELAQVDPRVAPGFSAKAELAAEGQARPMVPADYVRDGKLRVRKGQEIVTIDVKTGKADGTMVQIVEGLEPGATVLPPEPAPATAPGA